MHCATCQRLCSASFCKCRIKKLDETKYFPISYHTVLDVLPGFLLDISRMKECIRSNLFAPVGWVRVGGVSIRVWLGAQSCT
jgi:hypothetical protein